MAQTPSLEWGKRRRRRRRNPHRRLVRAEIKRDILHRRARDVHVVLRIEVLILEIFEKHRSAALIARGTEEIRGRSPVLGGRFKLPSSHSVISTAMRCASSPLSIAAESMQKIHCDMRPRCVDLAGRDVNRAHESVEFVARDAGSRQVAQIRGGAYAHAPPRRLAVRQTSRLNGFERYRCPLRVTRRGETELSIVTPIRSSIWRRQHGERLWRGARFLKIPPPRPTPSTPRS